MEGLKIDELAKQTGVSVRALRYYEQRVLLKPFRTALNYRLYHSDAVQPVRFIKRARGVGFTFREIKELLLLRATPGASCVDVRSRVEAKVRAIDSNIRRLKARRSIMNTLIGDCSETAPVTECPVLKALEGTDMQQTQTPD